MKKLLAMLLTMAMILSLAACQKPASDAPESTPAAEADGPINMEAVLTAVAKDHPDANTAELAQALLENPYFRMFNSESTEYVYWGLDYEYMPSGIQEASCVVDFISGSGALVYVIVPEAGTDAEQLGKEFEENADVHWLAWEEDSEMVPDQFFSKVIDGKLFFAMYRSEMLPITGQIAERPRDFVDMFHTYVKEHAAESCLDVTKYLASHQKFTEMMTAEKEEGMLMGFKSEIKGFAEGAACEPMMSPNLFIAYVFRVPADADADKFQNMVKEKADLAWNVCMIADTIIVEREGDLVLFMMCSEAETAVEAW